MPISAHPIAAAPAAPQPAPQPAGCAPAQGDESPFAKLLSAQPQPKPQEAAKPADKAAQSDNNPGPKADDKPVDTPTPTTAQPRLAKPVVVRGAAAGERAPRADTPLDPVKEDTDIALAATPETVADQPEAADTAAPATTMDPALAQWLASLNRPVAMPAPAAPVAAPGAGDIGEVRGGVLDTRRAAIAQGPQTLARDKAETHDAKTAEAAKPGIEVPQLAGRHSVESAQIAAFDERPAAQAPAERAPAVDTTQALGALAASSASAPAHRSEAAAPALPVILPTPVSSPEFKGALGMQVSVLARDGIQHAELHLNPAEMGPISVQIALDGAQARVDFGADSLATRQIIEAGLPELASALRDAGLTLSGGGVSQHSRGQSSPGDGAPQPQGDNQPANHLADDATPAARRVNLRVAQGGVDLYA